MHRHLYGVSGQRPSFRDVGFRIHSQHEEDGILLFLFALLGMSNRMAVEICCGSGIECNAANLVINHGFTALMMDGKADNIRSAREFFHSHSDTKYWPPTLIHSWITAENCNDLVKRHGFSGELDLLSVDIDGIDYWLWRALTSVNPRVVVIEFNHLWGAKVSVTVPYAPDFRAEFTQYGSDYAGASLPAMVKLAKQKGYRLVGTNRFATNAFFVRNDLQHPWLLEVSCESCFTHPRAIFGETVRLPKVSEKPWVDV